MVRRLAAIMFTDVVGSTQLAQTDEKGTLELLQEQDKLARPLLAAHRGRLVKSTGDGMLVEFANTLDAVGCAVEFQRQVHERNLRHAAMPLRVRIGIHVGDVEGRGTDILGDAVNIAARVEPLAEPGGVCLSRPVYDQVHNKVPYTLEKLGPRALKGVLEPVEIYRIALPWAAPPPPPKGPGPPRLAVLPLTNISSDSENDYFADGLTEELISVISRIKGLRVISRTSVSQFKGTSKSVAQIASELGVSAVLEGSVRKEGDQLRITIQLIDAATDEHRWVQTFDRRLENIFAVQAEVAERTANALKVELVESEREAIHERPTSSLAAYESYLRGVQADHRFGAGSLELDDRQVAGYFEDAIREDPEFSEAYSALGNHLIHVMGEVRSVEEVVPRARELVDRALELNPSSADAHVVRGNLAMQVDLEWKRAEREFQQAIALNPSNSNAHWWYGNLLWVVQRYDEAKTHILAASELDPLWSLPKGGLVTIYESLGDLTSALDLGEKLMKSSGTSLGARGTVALLYERLGRTEEALRLGEAMPKGQDVLSRWHRASVLAALGKSDEALALLADWENGRVRDYIALTRLAELYALCGEKEKALKLLDRDYREGEKVLWYGYQSRALDSIREDPRFIALLRAMNLPTEPPPRLTGGGVSRQ